jgi:NAD(P)-dependent dehydrogenase (short-subunit alcohol dehydrogenase family)
LLAAGAASVGLLAACQQANAASPATPVQAKAHQTATGNAFAITENMSGRIAFITGGDTGLGFECAAQLAKAGATVVLGCSDAANGNAAAAKIREVTGSQTDCACLPLDLGSIASVKTCVKQFLAKYPELHILINNAEVTASAERRLTTDQLEYTMGVNHLGHFVLTAGLLDRLRRSHGGVRVINLVSSAAVVDATGIDLFEDLRRFSAPDDDDGCAHYNPRSAFCKSKLANVLFTVELQRRLDEAPVLALNAGASPGLPGGYGSVTVSTANAERGTLTPLYLAATATLPQGARGGYFEEPGRPTALANPAASDGALATALWDASEAATGESLIIC